MTLETLINSPIEAEKLSDAELEAIFSPCFPTTRPELAAIKRANDGVTRVKKKGGGGLGEALALQFLANCGVKLSK